MAVTKRLRYEVLRRDNHACRYCGASAPAVPLTVDHVIPTALGGSDDPTNLVSACRDCNAGKSASAPNADIVADVDRDARRWGLAMQRAAELAAEAIDREQSIIVEVELAWTRWWFIDSRYPDHMDIPISERQYMPRPDDWERSVATLHRAGLDQRYLRWAVNEAATAPRVAPDNVFRYFAGICWRELERRREVASAMLAADEIEERR